VLRRQPERSMGRLILYQPVASSYRWLIRATFLSQRRGQWRPGSSPQLTEMWFSCGVELPITVLIWCFQGTTAGELVSGAVQTLRELEWILRPFITLLERSMDQV